MNAKQIKETYTIIEFLNHKGFAPEKIKGNNYWYISPIRDGERTASFKVDSSKNVWFDHGLGIGGNIIDLGIKIFDTDDISTVLKAISETFSFFPQQKRIVKSVPKLQRSPKLKVNEIRDIKSRYLINYLNKRGISIEVAQRYCKEYSYTNAGRDWVSIGFQNQSGGAELRSPNFKSCVSPKDISLIENGGENLLLFEGFFDFLSYLMIPAFQIENADYLVLSSLALVNRLFSLLPHYEKVYLFLDNDQAGKEAVITLKAEHPKVIDMSGLYSTMKDLNEYLITRL